MDGVWSMSSAASRAQPAKVDWLIVEYVHYQQTPARKRHVCSRQLWRASRDFDATMQIGMFCSMIAKHVTICLIDPF